MYLKTVEMLMQKWTRQIRTRKRKKRKKTKTKRKRNRNHRPMGDGEMINKKKT
jgi:hypothetical protein